MHRSFQHARSALFLRRPCKAEGNTKAICSVEGSSGPPPAGAIAARWFSALSGESPLTVGRASKAEREKVLTLEQLSSTQALAVATCG